MQLTDFQQWLFSGGIFGGPTNFLVPMGVMRDVQQIVDFGQFLFLFRCLPDFNGLSLDGFHAGSDHHLCSRNSPYLLPPDAGVSLLLQAVHGDGDYPVGQHGQIQVRLYLFFMSFRQNCRRCVTNES